MSISDTNEDEVKRVLSNVKPFVPRLITGGKGGDGEPWLNNLNQGDVFLARLKTVDKHGNTIKVENFELSQFEILYKTEKSVKLKIYLTEQDYRTISRWVDPISFSREIMFHEVIGNTNEIEEE